MFATRRTPSNLSTFYTAATEPSIQIPQQYPFVSQSSRQVGQAGMHDISPEFPAHMISMESTADESSEPSSQQSMQRPRPQSQAAAPQQQPQLQQRPIDTSSDSGTYSYFTVVIRSSKLGLAQLASWAAPMRPNQPSTGKPCNSIFSRPYDLTRHEDTIHNARKQKVRCHLCTEEKTFSRNDALTRHMRVVHPDVDWVGKQKRKNQK
ncbi:C2H2 transcription factor [Aspergillus sclerotialis]|uniref:C2H2 transcription factor n=1 Tax=Aspergillus sclerotialis TaxID=2070753 RepID=A0A3A2Z7Y5_9EURO|nr:C2H2 transcription factor [Aspergillus sclerotialis]